MSLKLLINNQIIRIDTHQSGNREINSWDDGTQDIHIDKTTYYKINGKKQSIRIKIPLNSDREISVINGSKKWEISRALKKEIQDIFKDKARCKEFIFQLSEILLNYPSQILEDDQRLYNVIDKICFVFWLSKLDLTRETNFFSLWKKVAVRHIYLEDRNRYVLKINNEEISLNWKNK